MRCDNCKMKEFDYSHVQSYKFAEVMKPFLKFLAKAFMRIEYEGVENIPEKGGYIVASNHVSAPDPTYILTEIKTPVHYMNKKEHFKNPVMRWIYTRFNSFPVNRGQADRKAIDYSIKVIEAGNILGIFPEGTRSKDYKPKQARTGVALIARETKADVLPVALYTSDRAKPFSKLTVRFGPLIPYEALGFGEGGKSEELKAASDIIMKEIVELWKQGHGEKKNT